jgi:hypothetical protein
MTLPHPAIPHPPLDDKRRFQMAASDDLTKLADRAKEAEERVAAAREKGKAHLEADRDNARAVGEQQAEDLRELAETGKGRISDRWEGVQEAWNQAIAKVREDVEGRKTEHDLHKAQRRADRADDDARFAIDFAYSAIGEAEYAVLDASLARMEADEQSEEAGKEANASV